MLYAVVVYPKYEMRQSTTKAKQRNNLIRLVDRANKLKQITLHFTIIIDVPIDGLFDQVTISHRNINRRNAN